VARDIFGIGFRTRTRSRRTWACRGIRRVHRGRAAAHAQRCDRRRACLPPSTALVEQAAAMLEGAAAGVDEAITRLAQQGE
jgi:hypothetical protein